jgi:hypothetical protein
MQGGCGYANSRRLECMCCEFAFVVLLMCITWKNKENIRFL